MSGGAKSLWEFRRGLCNAAFQVEHLATGIAVEVMVVLFARYFIAGCIARNLHRLQPFFFDEALDIAIDRPLFRDSDDGAEQPSEPRQERVAAHFRERPCGSPLSVLYCVFPLLPTFVSQLHLRVRADRSWPGAFPPLLRREEMNGCSPELHRIGRSCGSLDGKSPA